MSFRVAPLMVTRVGRAFPGDGDPTFPTELNDRTRRNVRVAPAWGITVQIPRGQDIDPSMPALRLRGPWKPAPDALPVASPAVAGGIPVPAKKGCCGGR